MAEAVRVQYGGSVSPANALELMSKPNIDGGLVGGASLKADSFVEIVSATAQAKGLACAISALSQGRATARPDAIERDCRALWLPLVYALAAIRAVAARRQMVRPAHAAVVFLLTGSQDAALYLYHFILLPGTILHEVAHWLTAKLLGVRTAS